MTLFLAGLSMSCYFLALCYALVSFLTITKFRRINSFLKNRGLRWSTVQLLLFSIALGCIFRCMSFSTLCILDFEQIGQAIGPEVLNSKHRQHLSDRVISTTDNSLKDLFFYNKVVAVLFNLPDWLIVSSYLLLVLVWAECFQSSRRHWFSAEQFRRKWMIFYLVFNATMYSTQLVLYALLFVHDDHDIFVDDRGKQLNTIPALIYYIQVAADLSLPLIIFGSWIYLSLSLSGFPFKSSSAKFRLKRVGRVTTAWSLGRISYSIMVLLTFSKGWFNMNPHSNTVQSMVLVAVFLATELAPIYLVLDSELLSMLSADDYEPLADKPRQVLQVSQI